MVKGSVWARDAACVPTGDFGSERERERERDQLGIRVCVLCKRKF